MQSIGLISAGGALEDTPPFTADPLNKARPNRVTPLGQLQGGTPEAPTRASNTSNWNHRAGVNVGSYSCTGRIVQQDGLRSGGPCACVSSTSGQGGRATSRWMTGSVPALGPGVGGPEREKG